jgi:AraC family transcriptional regulator of adaptative response/methylated-DNA-[protein]-cysteine methyltransferase
MGKRAEKGLSDDARWAAILARDPDFDDDFVYSVATTGVYCRASCPSRRANRNNVEFHASAAAARRAGFRPCKRCKPDEPSLKAEHTAKVAQACRMIEQAEETLKLEEIAVVVGLSAYHFHRIFKSIAGVTPKGYAIAHRNARIRDKLPRSTTVTEAIYDSGYGSNGQFYGSSSKLLGMTPRKFRSGASGELIRFALGECSLGTILVAASEKGVSAILLGDDPDALLRDLEARFPKAELIGGDKSFEATIAKVVGFVEAPQLGLDLPLDARGTAFQHRVWQALREIPVGETASYSEIATRIGAPQSIRGVAGACAANPLAIAIPCHRVVRTDGGLSGYRWGVARKRALLKRESNS